MSARDDLIPILKRLRLSGVLLSLDVRIEESIREKFSQEELLVRLLTDEVERRDSKQSELRLSRANFEFQKTLQDFDFSFNPSLPRNVITELSTCNFVGQKRNIILVGPTGTGKSHISQALGHRACMAGYSVLYTPANELFMRLRTARGEGTRDKQLLKLGKLDLLIIDDLGLHPLVEEEPLDLYDLIRSRYERKATIITSNRAVEEWYSLFRDELLASAAMDRLLHHARIVEMGGNSYRTRGPARKEGVSAF